MLAEAQRNTKPEDYPPAVKVPDKKRTLRRGRGKRTDQTFIAILHLPRQATIRAGPDGATPVVGVCSSCAAGLFRVREIVSFSRSLLNLPHVVVHDRLEAAIIPFYRDARPRVLEHCSPVSVIFIPPDAIAGFQTPRLFTRHVSPTHATRFISLCAARLR